MELNNWTKCYEDGWKDHIVPEAFSHPAKMAYGLLSRILTHAEEQGWLAPSSIICDCFGGISTTGILAAYRGYQAITCELEDKFVTLALENMELHRKKWEKLGCPVPIVISGDSRRLCELVESADIIVKKGLTNTIVPVTLDEKQENNNEKKMERQIQGRNTISLFPTENEPKTDRKILRCMSTADSHCDETIGDSIQKQRAKRQRTSSVQRRKEQSAISNNDNKGQVPPMQNNGESGHTSQKRRPLRQPAGESGSPLQFLSSEHDEKEMVEGEKSRVTNSKKQCANGMEPVSLIISSPPYEGALGNRKHEGDQKKYLKRQKRYNEKHPEYKRPSAESMCYPCSEGNIANNSGDTFWQAAKEILEQCHKILRPGGHAIFVCKDFVRKGKRVPFSDDWLKLCEAVGFKLVCRHRAMLVKEDVKDDLFGGQIIKKTERKSFFRRLAEAKGSPKIDWEDVICVEKFS